MRLAPGWCLEISISNESAGAMFSSYLPARLKNCRTRVRRDTSTRAKSRVTGHSGNCAEILNPYFALKIPAQDHAFQEKSNETFNYRQLGLAARFQFDGIGSGSFRSRGTGPRAESGHRFSG